jgi:aspartokinase
MFFGEIFSSILLKETIIFLKINSINIKSSELIKTETNYLDALVDFKKTQKLCSKFLKDIDLSNTIPVITGFAGSDKYEDINLL